MFHLLGDVYVESEFQSKPSDHQINISENRGYQRLDFPGSLGLGTQLGWGMSLDDFTPSEFYALLLKAMEFNDKVYVFADSKTYTRMYAILLFALFPKIDYRTFKTFFICIKATYSTSTVTFYDRVFGHEMAILINADIVKELWEHKDDPLVAPLRRLIKARPDYTSLEWRIIKMMSTQSVGTVPDTIGNIMRRTAMSNSLDALDDWGRIIADPTRWDISGATEESLLASNSIFEACVNFGELANPFIRSPENKKKRYPDEWYIDLLEKIVLVLTDCGDLPSAARSDRLRQLFLDTSDMTVYENVIARIRRLFDGGKDNFRLGHVDSAKYNENLIRHVIRLDDAQVRALMEGSEW